MRMQNYAFFSNLQTYVCNLFKKSFHKSFSAYNLKILFELHTENEIPTKSISNYQNHPVT